MEGETDPNRGGLYYCNNHFKIILTKFIEIDMMAVQASEKRMRDMIITKETDYALRILRVLLDGEKHSVAEMSETEFIPNQFAYQILRKLSAGNLVQVSRGALGGCELSCDLDATSLYDLMGVMGERGVLRDCMEPGYECRWQGEHGRTLFAPTDVCGIIKGCEINNNAKCQRGVGCRGRQPLQIVRGSSLCRKIATLGALFYFMLAIYLGLLCLFLIPHSSLLISHFSLLT